jgi:hypothetical protein
MKRCETMLKLIKIAKKIITGVVLVGLTACGPGDDRLAGGGIGGTGVISTGEITALGSIWVNDLEFDTSEADIYINGVLEGTGDGIVVKNLSPGQIVKVEGILSEDGTAFADMVFYTSSLTGPIDAVDAADGENIRIQCLGQWVIVGKKTRLKGIDAVDLKPGILVEVSGFFNGEEEIEASFLAKKADSVPAGYQFRISGKIKDLDPNGQCFHINTLPVNFGQADVVGFLNGVPENGRLAAVSGQMGNNVFIARTVELYGRLGEENDKDVQIQGVISEFAGENRFFIEGYEIEITLETRFTGGKEADLSTGANIIVEGDFVNGIIVADKINFRWNANAVNNIGGQP